MTPLSSLPPDPRRDASIEDLDAASRNSFPIVARAARGRDHGLMLGGGLALALGVLTFATLRHAPEQVAPPPMAQTQEPAAIAPQPAEPALPAGTITPIDRPAANLPLPAGALASASASGTANPVALVYDSPSRETAPPPATPAPRATGGPSGTASPMLNENEAFGLRVGNGAAETASATRMEHPALTVAQGTLISAILETAIDSDLPGYARAIVSGDVRSFDGSRVLIPRSSRLIGQYKSGLQAGQTRVYVVWQRLIRPDGVSVALASPAMDFAGQAGLSGSVNNHFFKRYSAAMLLSVLAGVGSLGSSGTSVVISSGSQGAASVAAQNDAKTPPTIRVPLGQPIRVFTARDLDFASAEP